MLGLALFLKNLGFSVTGSDAFPKKEAKDICKKNSIKLYSCHKAENPIHCEAFVYSAAISDDNEELKTARKLGLEILTRSQLLGRITENFAYSIAISGTHGKSTVTNMLYSVFTANGLSPSLLAGAELIHDSAPSIFGNDDILIYEACEYKRSFLDTTPSIAVILNIEKEHVDVYPSLSDSKDAFFRFLSKCQTVILNEDCPICRSLVSEAHKLGITVYTFSTIKKESTLYAKNITFTQGKYSFDAVLNGKPFIENISLSIFGMHNVYNTLATILTAYVSGINDKEKIKAGTENFRGIKRRFEYIGNVNGADVYDDYAHHPTEIKATLDAARKLGYEKIVCAFQPHTYSRTKEFFYDFAKAFNGCDEVIITDIFAAREKKICGINSSMLAKEIKNGKYISSKSDIYEHLLLSAHPKTLILTMGAGELDEVAKKLCEKKE